MPPGVSAVGEVVETRLGKMPWTCWAMKPNCGTRVLVGIDPVEGDGVEGVDLGERA